jgi:hypothetical protein
MPGDAGRSSPPAYTSRRVAGQRHARPAAPDQPPGLPQPDGRDLLLLLMGFHAGERRVEHHPRRWMTVQPARVVETRHASNPPAARGGSARIGQAVSRMRGEHQPTRGEKRARRSGLIHLFFGGWESAPHGDNRRAEGNLPSWRGIGNLRDNFSQVDRGVTPAMAIVVGRPKKTAGRPRIEEAEPSPGNVPPGNVPPATASSAGSETVLLPPWSCRRPVHETPAWRESVRTPDWTARCRTRR